MFESETNVAKQVSLHDIGLSSISTESESDYYSTESEKQKNSELNQKNKENNWFETCIEIRELALQVLSHVEEVPVHSRDQKSFIKQIIFSLVSKILFGSNQKNKEDPQMEQKYNDLQLKYEDALTKIQILENQISAFEQPKQEKLNQKDNHKTPSKEKSLQTKTEKQINLSIQQIAKLVEKQTKNQQKLIEAVVSHEKHRKSSKSQNFTKNDDFMKSNHKHNKKGKHKQYKDTNAFDSSSDVFQPKKIRKPNKQRNSVNQKQQDKDFLDHINELVGKTNDIQNQLIDITGRDDLTLSKLSMLNESLLIAERNFKLQNKESEYDYTSSSSIF